LSVANENAKRNNLDQISTFERFDLFEDDVAAFKEKLGGFDMVVSNPPYVSSEDMRKVEGKWWEGRFALQGKLKGEVKPNGSLNEMKPHVQVHATSTASSVEDDDGLSFYRRIHEIYSIFLSPTRSTIIPKLVLEVGDKQAPAVKAMYKEQGRLEVIRETARRRDLSTPKLEEGDMVGTERCLWIYDS